MEVGVHLAHGVVKIEQAIGVHVGVEDAGDSFCGQLCRGSVALVVVPFRCVICDAPDWPITPVDSSVLDGSVRGI